MKKSFSFIICIIACFVVLFKIDTISEYIARFLDNDKRVYIAKPNAYHKDYDFMFVQESKDYVPYSYQDLLNIVFSTLNNGWEKFTFYCPDEYENCQKDMDQISSDTVLLTNIDDYVHPFNGSYKIKVLIDNSGEITIEPRKTYSSDDIDKNNKDIDEIIKELITDDMSDDDKLLKIHDYIINNTRYDVNRDFDASNTALGPLFNGKAICSGYADLMAIFLTKLNIKNFKVSSETHVWNAVYMNGEWLHLDLTWDDPVTKNSDVDTLQHNFFLVDTKKLLEFDIKDHEFDTTIFQELR